MVLCLAAGLMAAGLLRPASTPEAQISPVAPATPASFSELVKKASPSVVNINVVKVVKGGGGLPLPLDPDNPLRDFFERYFGDQMPKDFKQRGLGTGFIIDKDGFVLTNNHVVESAEEIAVTLSDKRELAGKIIGRDPKTDLALIKVNSDRPLIALPLGNSDRLEVGDWVVAIGNPFGLGNTVTAGIVSAKYRQIGAGAYDNFIQTDASINPGNSGGPLLNIAGEVVGINSAIFSQTGGSIGIGFAIPINMARDLLPQLEKGKVVRGWLGVMIQRITPDLKDKFGLKAPQGALVADVTSGGPADKAGIKRGDVIVSFDGKTIKEMNDLPYLVASTPIGKNVTVEVIRKGRKEDFQVKIAELKEEEPMEISKAQPDLGMTAQEITPQVARELGLSETSGIVILEVEGDSPAAEAGILPGDIILEIDHEPVENLAQFSRKMKTYKSGDTILFLVKREEATLYLTLKMEQ
jgi:serine protease Do